jgi:hypothetical protein
VWDVLSFILTRTALHNTDAFLSTTDMIDYEHHQILRFHIKAVGLS